MITSERREDFLARVENHLPRRTTRGIVHQTWASPSTAHESTFLGFDDWPGVWDLRRKARVERRSSRSGETLRANWLHWLTVQSAFPTLPRNP
jgi:hypothetical protein